MTQETYSLLSLDEDLDEDRTATTRYAPLENMLSATDLVVSLLEAHLTNMKPSYAIQGGFSMQLRGGRQSTRDVDLVTVIKMRGVWEAITGEVRLVIPDSRLVEGIVKVFVKTGPDYDACAEAHLIEVDIKQAGFRGSPRILDGNVEVVGPFQHFGQALHFNILNITSMMRIKIECCLSREEARDFEDVRFMITSYGEQVRAAIEVGVIDEDELHEVLSNEKMGDEATRKRLKRDCETGNLVQGR